MGASVTLTKPDPTSGVDRQVDQANPLPVALGTSDAAALAAASGVYSDAVAYSGATTVGRGVMIVASAAGTATLTFGSGRAVVVPVNVGLSILPFSCTNAVQTTGAMSLYKLT